MSEKRESIKKKKNTAFMNLPFIFNPSFHLNEFFFTNFKYARIKKRKGKKLE